MDSQQLTTKKDAPFRKSNYRGRSSDNYQI